MALYQWFLFCDNTKCPDVCFLSDLGLVRLLLENSFVCSDHYLPRSLYWIPYICCHKAIQAYLEHQKRKTYLKLKMLLSGHLKNKLFWSESNSFEVSTQDILRCVYSSVEQSPSICTSNSNSLQFSICPLYLEYQTIQKEDLKHY